MKPKLRHAEQLLRKKLLSAFGKSLPPDETTKAPWFLLRALTRDHPVLPDDLKSALTSVIDSESISGYLELQKFAEPQLYSSAAEFYSAISVLSFLKKYPFGKVATLDPLLSAEKSSERAERLCRITNRRLRWYRSKGYRHSNRWQGVHSVLHTARLLISRWLGPLDLDEIYAHMRHGPGGAIGTTGSDTTAYYKYAAPSYTVTTRALPYAEAAILADPLWRRYVVDPNATFGDPVPSVSESRQAVLKRLSVVNYNKVTYVPKTAQTHRAIAIEPLLNIYLQLGVGDWLTEKLRKFGLNLRSQHKNQIMARAGSSWEYACWDRPVTLDLSMASDTLSYELVKELLPEEWFEFLDCLRSPNGLYKGVKTRWAKFSSMGNGFTFQLESLIFYALASSVAKHLGFERRDIAVYGDDIIVPAGMALRLVDILAYTGFKVNTSKSFFFGPFRESCGRDWFEGRDVRPFFLKRKIQSAKDYIFVFNSFGKKDRSFDPGNYSDHFRSNIRECCYLRLPNDIVTHLLGPVTSDLEGHLHVPFDFASRSRCVRWDVHLQTWSYASVKVSPRYLRGETGPLTLQLLGSLGLGRGELFDEVDPSYLALLRGLSTAGSRNASVTRRQFTKSRLATQASNGWRND